jgi:hypothetical protein
MSDATCWLPVGLVTDVDAAASEIHASLRLNAPPLEPGQEITVGSPEHPIARFCLTETGLVIINPRQARIATPKPLHCENELIYRRIH